MTGLALLVQLGALAANVADNNIRVSLLLCVHLQPRMWRGRAPLLGPSGQCLCRSGSAGNLGCEQAGVTAWPQCSCGSTLQLSVYNRVAYRQLCVDVLQHVCLQQHAASMHHLAHNYVYVVVVWGPCTIAGYCTRAVTAAAASVE